MLNSNAPPDRMRAPRRILLFIVCILIGLVLLLVTVSFQSEYRRFMKKSPRYYAELARACDTLIHDHPLGTNTLLHLPRDDASLPQIIRKLNPHRVALSSNRVHFIVGAGRLAFGVSWEPLEGQTNVWAIATSTENVGRVAYVENR
jgi:hypothetical protein